jgi:hypothetical protein
MNAVSTPDVAGRLTLEEVPVALRFLITNEELLYLPDM